MLAAWRCCYSLSASSLALEAMDEVPPTRKPTKELLQCRSLPRPQRPHASHSMMSPSMLMKRATTRRRGLSQRINHTKGSIICLRVRLPIGRREMSARASHTYQKTIHAAMANRKTSGLATYPIPRSQRCLSSASFSVRLSTRPARTSATSSLFEIIRAPRLRNDLREQSTRGHATRHRLRADCH